MSNSSSSSAGRGVNLLGPLTIVFIVLKLCHVIDWSWWLVLAPLWGQLAFILLLLMFIGLAVVVKEIIRRK